MNYNLNPEDFLNKRWYIQGFNATPNLISHGHISAIKGMWNKLGYGYTLMMNSFKEDYCEYYYGWFDFETIEKEISLRLAKNPRYLKELEKEDKELRKKQYLKIKESLKINLKKITPEDLIKLYQELFYWYCEPLSISHFIEAFLLLEEKLKKKLMEYYEQSEKKEKFNTYFTLLTQPIRSSFANEEHCSLLNLLKIIQEDQELQQLFSSSSEEELLLKIKNKKFRKELKKHEKRFYWVRCNYAYGEGSTISNFLKELKILLEKKMNPEEELKKEAERYSFNKREKKRVLRELRIKDPETRRMLKISEQLLHWQDDRKKMMLMGLSSVSRVLYEIAERYLLPKRLILYLRPGEIKEEILSKITPEELQERKQGCIFLWENLREGNKYDYKTTLLTGKEYRDFTAKLKEEKEEKVSDFHGTCASTGTASGKVRVCRTKLDLENFQEGEVLVASMTRPEYVPAIKKSAAIITDEGGITCHAAIVSRELGKPCVIGTKIATKVLKDGMEVEVRANHGLVKIISK